MIGLLFNLLLLAQSLPFEVKPVTVAENKIAVKTAENTARQQLRLTKLMLQWQRQLGLMHYVIAVRVVPFSQLEAGTMASIYFDQHQAMGYLSILEESEYKKVPKDARKPTNVGKIRKDQDDSVVHELLHLLMFEPYPYGTEKQQSYEEYRVVKLTQALLKEKP